MSKVVNFAYNPVQPFHFSTIDDDTTYEPTVLDQVDIVSGGSGAQDVVHWSRPILRDDGVYSGSFQVVPATATTDDLGSNKKLSFGFAVPSNVVHNTLVSFKLSVLIVTGKHHHP